MDQEFFEDTMKLMFQFEPMSPHDWISLAYASAAMILAFGFVGLFFL